MEIRELYGKPQILLEIVGKHHQPAARSSSCRSVLGFQHGARCFLDTGALDALPVTFQFKAE
jgi:hypothetical protein